MRGLRADVLAPQRDTPGARRQKAEQGLEHRGLAGAVASDDGDDLVLSRAQRDVFQRKCLAVMHLGMQQFDHAATSSPR
ncbi:hypothetical protein G6F46_014597 [Rhizopus delemar]|nr:hypothetical protein G6F46_014597 [Rhizopus delemar]